MRLVNSMGSPIAVVAISCLLVLSSGQSCRYGETCPADNGPQHILMVGNPGAGKSTILNGLAGNSIFKSGTSMGKGLTHALDIHTVGNRVFMDTPGLADIEMRRRAAKEIEAALKKGGEFKIFFVITLESGRIRPSDKSTVKVVLDACPDITKYGVIVNKLEDDVLEEITNDQGIRNLVQNKFVEGLKIQSGNFHFEPRRPGLASATNAGLQIDAKFRSFVENLPSVIIRTEEVKQIEVDEMARLQKVYEAEVARMQREQEEMKRKREEQRLHFERQLNPAYDFLGKKVFIKSYNGFYLQDHGWRGKISKNPGLWETWTLVNAGDGKCFIRSYNGNYLQDHDWVGKISTNPGGWEKWSFRDAGNGQFFIRSYNGYYLQDHGWRAKMSGNAKGWEKWTIVLA